MWFLLYFVCFNQFKYYYFNNYSKPNIIKIYKKIDNTCINYITNDTWSNDFKRRFENHEPKTNIKMKQLINNLRYKSSIIDVGSHVGDTGLYLAKIASKIRPDITIIMIDPDKSKISFIEDMIKINNLKNCRCFNWC